MASFETVSLASAGRIATGLMVALVALAVLGALQSPDTTLPAGLRGTQVTVDGIRLRYMQAGSGRDVLLIHGSPGSVEDWQPVFERLAARFRVTAFDRPGHGYSEGSRLSHTLGENARIALALVRALGLRDVIVVGHSYGGATALRMGAAAPLEVRALVVVASRAYPPVTVEPIYRALDLPYVGTGLAVLLTPLMGRARVESGVRSSFGPNADAIPAHFIDERAPLWSRPTIVSTLSEERVSLQDDLATTSAHDRELRVPLWILCGAADTRNYEDAQRLAREAPGARLVTLGNTGHYVQFAHPEAVEAAVGEAASASYEARE